MKIAKNKVHYLFCGWWPARLVNAGKNKHRIGQISVEEADWSRGYLRIPADTRIVLAIDWIALPVGWRRHRSAFAPEAVRRVCYAHGTKSTGLLSSSCSTAWHFAMSTANSQAIRTTISSAYYAPNILHWMSRKHCSPLDILQWIISIRWYPLENIHWRLFSILGSLSPGTTFHRHKSTESKGSRLKSLRLIGNSVVIFECMQMWIRCETSVLNENCVQNCSELPISGL